MTAARFAPFAAVAVWLAAVIPPAVQRLGRATPADLAAGRLPKAHSVRLTLPPTAMLLRRIVLPASTDRARRRAQIVARLEEVSPWAEGEFLWDALPVPRSDTEVELAMVPRALVSEAEAVLAGAGRRLVDVRGEGASGQDFHLFVDPGRLRGFRVGLLAAWLLVSAGAVAQGLWQLRVGMEADAATARAEAGLARAAARSAAGSDGLRAVQELERRKQDGIAMVGLLDQLAERLPDDAWLHSATVEPDHFEMVGSADTPEAIIPSLQQSPMFADVDYAGSSTRDPDSGLYTFSVKGRVVAAEPKP